MAFDDLPAFLKYAADEGQLVRVSAEVNADEELAAIAQHVGHAQGGWAPVLLFERVQGSKFPVVTHLLSSTERFLKALGTPTFDAAVGRVVQAFTPRFAGAEGWLESLKTSGGRDGGRVLPKTLRIGLCQQIVKLGKDVSLAELPVPKCWPGESGPSITAGVVHLTPLEGTSRHVGLYSAEVIAPDALLLHWHASEQPQRMAAAFLKAGRQMPVAISLGGDPLIPCIASLPLPEFLDPYLFAGLLRGESINLVKGRSVELEVPAEAEIVIEGYIDPVEPAGTGTLANAMGYLDRNERLPLMRVTGITHRANPVFPMLLRGAPPCEELVHAQLTERLLLPVAKMLAPEIVDLHLPLAGHAERILFVSINKSAPMQGKRVMNTLWGLPVFSRAKLIVVVDGDVDLRQPDAVWQRVATHVHPQRDCVQAEGPAGMDDHAAPIRGIGSRLGLDATVKLASEGHPRRWPAACKVSPEVAEKIRANWSSYALGEFPKPQ